MSLRDSPFLFLLLTLFGTMSARANVPAPPPATSQQDSIAARWEGGSELTRWLGGYRVSVGSDTAWRVSSKSSWVTGLTRGQSSVGRVRHDARWALSAARPLAERVRLWAGATGQHYNDRPRAGASTFAGQGNRSHLIRGGLGPQIEWTRYLATTHSIGAIQDSRDDYADNGIASWQSALLQHRTPHNQHDGALSFDYERPGSRDGSDGRLSYSLAQDYEQAANRVRLQTSWTRRNMLTAPSLPDQFREEKALQVADELNYEIAGNTSLRGGGIVRYSDTRLDDRMGNVSRLEELESGLNVALDMVHGKREGTLSAELRTVSQNVRGEILSGRKVVLGALGATDTGPSRLTLQTTFSKYSLDTRSELNYDDRDELSWRFDGGVRTRHSPALTSQVQALVDLNHLVYIFARNSANNRWTRLLVLSTRFLHTPSSSVIHVPDFRISANYQAYDFETNPRQVRSTVFRKLAIGDSVAWMFRAPWSVTLGASASREELGRLYWEEFEQERSDQTDVFWSVIEFSRKFPQGGVAGLGVTYSTRRGDRFEFEKPRTRVQDIRTWGPTARVNLNSRGWFCQGAAQWVIQSELGRADREFISGSLTAGRTW